MKKMLFNATHAEELRVALVEGQSLIDLDIESAVRSERKGNIYKAVITKVEPSLEACFVNYGAERHGFLPLKEIYRGYFQNYDSQTSLQDIRINDVIKEGQEVIVQVDKDERGTKGAALTTFVSLAGRFLVLMPNNPKGGGISRRIVGEERNQLRAALDKLEIDKKHSLIARTAGIGRSVEELQWDLSFLSRLWETIEKASTLDKAPYLIYQEGNLVVRSIRDHLSNEVSEVIIDNKEIYDRATRFVKQVMPHNLKKIKFYNDAIPLFTRYQVENQIDAAFNREVSLPSGGSIVIDHTEALISIDVNSARATKGGDIEETAFQTNLQAVEEVARQLRIRDMGGLVVIDLIDMSENSHQKEVENRLKDALKSDRARVQVGQISRFGLLEMSRQRLRASISESNYNTCPRCEGTGIIRNVVSGSLAVLRVIEEEAQKENTEAIQVAVSLDMATYLFNEKRYELHQLESRLASRIIIIPTDDLESPQFTIRRLKGDELEKISGVASFEQKSSIVEVPDVTNELPESLIVAKPERSKIEVDDVMHETPPPQNKAKARTKAKSKPNKNGAQKSLIEQIKAWLFGEPQKNTGKKSASQKNSQKPRNKRERPDNKRNTQNRRKTDNRDNTQKQHKAKQHKQDHDKRGRKPSADKRSAKPRQNQGSVQNNNQSNNKANKPQQPQKNKSVQQQENVQAKQPHHKPAQAEKAPMAKDNSAGQQHKQQNDNFQNREKGKLSRTITPASQATTADKPNQNGSSAGEQNRAKTPPTAQDKADMHKGAHQNQQPADDGLENQQANQQKRERSTHLRNLRRRRPVNKRRNKSPNEPTEIHSNNKYPSDTNRDEYAPNKNFGKLPEDVGQKDKD